MRNAALLFSIVMVFLCLMTPSYAIQRTVTGSMDRSGFQTDTDGQRYLIHGEHNRTELIRVDVPERKATTVFAIGSLDGQITIGNGEICFRNIFVQPLFASHIGPHIYYTCAIENNSFWNWKAKTDLWTYYQPIHTQCAYVSDKLFLLEWPSEGAGARKPFQTSIYAIRENGGRQLMGTYENCLSWPFDTAIWIRHEDDGNGFTNLIDPVQEREIRIPFSSDNGDYMRIELLIHDETIYLAADYRVVAYDENSGTCTEILRCEDRVPALNCVGNELYIYSDHEHVLYHWDTEKKSVADQYIIPETIPYGWSPIVWDHWLVFHPIGNIMYVYDFENDVLDEIDFENR